MNPDDWRDNHWEYQRLDEIYHQRIDAIKDYYYNEDNFDDEANVKKYSERQMDMNLEIEKERLCAGFEKEMTELADEIDIKEDEIRKLKQEIADMKKEIKLIEKMKELLKQYALYSEIDFDEETLTLLV